MIVDMHEVVFRAFCEQVSRRLVAEPGYGMCIVS